MENKKEFKFFTIFNHEAEEKYLREQHKAGWKFVKVTGFGTYHFEKCQPEDVIYQLDYNQEGLKNKEEYIQMFADCGWTYLQEFAGYTYFRKSASEMDGEEEIFCDESSRLAMLERVYRGRLLPCLCIFCACLLPQFILNVMNERYLVAVFIGGILLVYIVLFVHCGNHYNRKKNKD